MNAKTKRRPAPRPRLRVLLVATAVVFSLCAGRAFQVQALDASAVAAQAADQITVSQPIPALRGTITDRNGEVLAFSEPTVNVVADPEMIRTNGKFDQPMTDRDKEIAANAAQRIAELMARYLGGVADTYLPALTKPGSRYSIVARQVSAAAFAQLASDMKDASLLGLYKVSAPTRRYPGGALASNVLGFVNSEGVGASGLELTLNGKLKGTDGTQSYETSPNGRIPLGTNVLTPAVNGQNYQLTLDAGLQVQVEQILADRVNTTRANWGTAVVLDVNTGEVLALANYPSFDSNAAGKAKNADRGNRAITDPYTPGSVEKTLTFAALLDTGTITPTTVVSVPGRIKSGSNWVNDAWRHDTVNLYARGILAKSSNVGTIKLARKLTKKTLVDYLTSFGLGHKTGIGLPGEASGVLPKADMPDYTRDGIAFGGSGMLVTTLQEAAAVAAVTNGGIYHQPTLVKSSTSADGTTQALPVAAPRRVVSAQTSQQVASLMEAMKVNSGSTVFDVTGYRVGTKTGTAKKWNTGCNCWRGLTTSVMGIAPVEAPQLLTYVVIDNPRQAGSGLSASGPAWRDIMSVALPRYGVPPSVTKPPPLPIAPK